MRLKLAVIAVGALTAIAAPGASAADFETDNGPCPETPGNGALLRCPTAYVGQDYEVELESEEGSGCEPYDWFEIVNSTLPAGLTMTREGVISGVPTSAGFARFWVWNHDLTFAQGGPDWCQREDRSEREFSIFVDPGLEITTDDLEGATIGQAYSKTLTARKVVTLSPPTGSDVQATWSLESGALPPGIALSPSGALTGTPTAEGSYQFVVRAQTGGPIAAERYTLSVRQAVTVKSPFTSAQRPSAEVGMRLAKTFTATGGSGTYTWALASGALPPGLALDATRGMVSGTPRAAGNFAFALTATDSEGRVATASAALTVAPRLAIKTLRLKVANLARAYRAKLVAVGGVQPLTWRVVRGNLPRGMRLSRLGTLVGASRQAGMFRMTVEARDALGARSLKTLVLLVEN